MLKGHRKRWPFSFSQPLETTSINDKSLLSNRPQTKRATNMSLFYIILMRVRTSGYFHSPCSLTALIF